MKKYVVIALVFFVLAVAIQLEQYVVYGHVWDASQVHHETFALLAVGLGVGFFFAGNMRGLKRRFATVA
jgi:hypothetical protein